MTGEEMQCTSASGVLNSADAWRFCGTPPRQRYDREVHGGVLTVHFEHLYDPITDNKFCRVRVSHWTHTPGLERGRYPTWDEILMVVRELCPRNIQFVPTDSGRSNEIILEEMPSLSAIVRRAGWRKVMRAMWGGE